MRTGDRTPRGADAPGGRASACVCYPITYTHVGYKDAESKDKPILTAILCVEVQHHVT